jgi:hypothetical protein
MYNFIIILPLFFLFVACAGQSTNGKLQDLDQVYQGAGVESFYLSDLPEWANFSPFYSCQREEPVRFLHFGQMYKNFSMDYEQLIQFQLMLNRNFASYKFSTGRKTIFLKDEAFIHNNVHQQILGGARDFIAPNFKRVHLIWVDPALSHENEKQKLKTLMRSKMMEKGHPIFISTCLSSSQLEKAINAMGLGNLGGKFISQSMFSAFGVDMNLKQEYSLHFDHLLPNKELYFFGPFLPRGFYGLPSKNILPY